MDVSSILKSPSAMAGAGTVGTGGLGVGGWQIYEEVNPSTHRQLSRQGYRWDPANIPSNETVSPTNKFNFNNWGCVNKLFPTLFNGIKHTESTSTIDIAGESTGHGTYGENAFNASTLYIKEPNKVTDNLVACALFDHRGGNDATKDKLHFKSEVVVKDQDYGWVMWTGLSNSPSTNPKKINFEYRLLTIKKENGNWKIHRGFGWTSPAPSSGSTGGTEDQLHVTIPVGDWQTVNAKPGEGYSKRRIWSGIAKIDKTSNKHLVQSLGIYMRNKSSGAQYTAEFFGVDGGKWHDYNRGYAKANRAYDTSSNEWKAFAYTKDLRGTLTEWYKPFMGKKEVNVRWMTCDSWSGERKSRASMTDADRELMNVCYTKVQQ